MRSVIDLLAVARLAAEPGIEAVTRDKAEAVVQRAQARAPKDTGAGAASIHAEKAVTPDGVEFRVSWDVDHDYMRFAEFGTVHERARPFLRTALYDETTSNNSE